jgi:quinol monooxygenase YgiN
MTQPLVYVDRSKVHDGALADLKIAIGDLARFVQENEPGLISYSVYFSDDDREMTVVHVHEDAASLDFHMDVVEPQLGRFADLLTLVSIHIYGEPCVRALGQLRDKIRLLGSGQVVVHMSHAGFIR